MTDYVIMPKQDYEEVCDFIRSKTAKAELIKSGDMVAEIEEAFVIGGSETHKTTAINYADFDNGTFKETLDTGHTLTYNVEFADGKPSKIITPNGTVVSVEWGMKLWTLIDEVTFYFSEFNGVYIAENYILDVHTKIQMHFGPPQDGDICACVVSIDGKQYVTKVVYQSATGEFLIGNHSIYSDGPDSGEPFEIIASSYATMVVTTQEGDSHTISLEVEV